MYRIYHEDIGITLKKSAMFCIGYTPTLLEGLHEEILGIVKFMK